MSFRIHSTQVTWQKIIYLTSPLVTLLYMFSKFLAEGQNLRIIDPNSFINAGVIHKTNPE